MKKLAFEYVLYKLVDWYKNASSEKIMDYSAFNTSNDLSKLKVIKLHFFVAAIDSRNNSLLETFNNFYAMPYGHVESDIYNDINNLERFSISNSALLIKNDFLKNLHTSFDSLDNYTKKAIDKAIQILGEENKDLITYPALDLVELSHTYFSWKCMYNLARSNNRYSERIPSELIKDEPKFFRLN